MYGGRSVIGIVPARGGSVGLPGKNVRDLCGKPLIAWTIEAGRASSLLDELLVTTDDEGIAAVARRYGASVPFLRPPELARGDSPTILAVRHAIRFYREERGREFDYVALLEPTSPLRERDDIDAMIRKLVDGADRFDSIVSIGEVHEHPSIMKRVRGESIEPFCPELPRTTRRQDNEPAYFPYGVAYIARTAALLSEGTFYTSRNTYHRIRRYQTYEIDDIYDFLAVEAILRHERGAP